MRPWERKRGGEGVSTPAPTNGRRTLAYGPMGTTCPHTSLSQDSRVQEEWDQKGSLPPLPFCSTDKPAEGYAGVGLGPCWRPSCYALMDKLQAHIVPDLSSRTFSTFPHHHFSTVILEFNGLEVHKEVFSLEDIKPMASHPLRLTSATAWTSAERASSSHAGPNLATTLLQHKVFQPQPGEVGE